MAEKTQKSNPLFDEQAYDIEYQRMFEDVMDNPDKHGVVDEAEAEILAHMLILEKEGVIVRTGERRLCSHGLMQEVFAAATRR